MKLKDSLKYLRIHEATISMLLGVLVIVFSGVILVNYFAQRKNLPQPKIEIGDEQATEVSHTVQKGEDLWKIAQNYLGDGNEWKKIAEYNGLSNADQIKEGDTIKIPQTSAATPALIAEASPSVTLIPTATTAPTATETPTPKLKPTAEAKPTKELTPTPSLIPSASPTAKPSPTKAPTRTPEVSVSPTPTVVTSDGQGGVSTEAKTHKVEKGENLWTIAEKYYTSGFNWVDIAKANKITDPGKISEGQTLLIPTVKAKTPTVATAGQTPAKGAISGNSYQVEKGDSLWDIAVRAYGDGYKWSEIARENKITNPNLIFSGTNLSIPR